MNSLIYIYRHFLVVVFSLLFSINIASASVASSALDDIGSEYTLDKNNDPFVTVTINNELEVSFSVKSVGDKGDLAFIHTSDSSDGVGSLICRVTSTCRGKQLSAALDSFINAIYNFKSNQRRIIGSASNSGATSNKSKSASNIFDVNTIPSQYRDSESKVKAWLKQEGYFGKQFSVRATVSMVTDSKILFGCHYNEEQTGLYDKFSFQAAPENYSPLDYNENDTYEVSGILGASMLGSLIIENPIIIPVEHADPLASSSSSGLSSWEIESGSAECINNLRLIDAGKEQYSLEFDINDDANVTPENITKYFKSQMLPTCPNGGHYTIGTMNSQPSCSIHGQLK